MRPRKAPLAASGIVAVRTASRNRSNPRDVQPARLCTPGVRNPIVFGIVFTSEIPFGPDRTSHFVRLCPQKSTNQSHSHK